MLKKAYLDEKIGFDPAENEPRKGSTRRASPSSPRALAGRSRPRRPSCGRCDAYREERPGWVASRLSRDSALSEARSRLDRSRFSRPNTHFSAFFKIYKKIIFSRANLANFRFKNANVQKICENLTFFGKFRKILQNFQKSAKFLQNFAEFYRNV